LNAARLGAAELVCSQSMLTTEHELVAAMRSSCAQSSATAAAWISAGVALNKVEQQAVQVLRRGMM
jgi:hypothetical protein